MYNENIKLNFLNDYAKSDNIRTKAIIAFERIEKYEREKGVDICAMNAEDLQNVLDNIGGARAQSKWFLITLLRKYSTWCIAHNIVGAKDNTNCINDVGLNKVRQQMVSGPLHLQKYLDEVFEDESENTIDNTYRSYMWFAFSGLSEKQALKLASENIDLWEMNINCDGKTYPVYRESLPALKRAVTESAFVYKNPSYKTKTVISRNRVSGNNILRGIKSTNSTVYLRSAILRRCRYAYEKGNTTQRISYERAKLSGVFYRLNELEKAGIEPDFEQLAVEHIQNEGLAEFKPENIRIYINRAKRDYEDNYYRWKVTFLI